MKEVQIMTSALVAHFVCGNPGNPKEEAHNKDQIILKSLLRFVKTLSLFYKYMSVCFFNKFSTDRFMQTSGHM